MPSPSEQGQAASSSDALARSELEAEVVRLLASEAEVVRERAAILLERAQIDEERGDWVRECAEWEVVRRQVEQERDELRTDRDAVLGRLTDLTEVLTRREAEWNAASAGMDEERARWVAEEAEYARLRDEDLAQLKRARRFSPRHHLGVLVHRLRG